MENLSGDHKDHPNQHKNSHKLCDEKEHPILSLTEQLHNQNVLEQGNPL